MIFSTTYHIRKITFYNPSDTRFTRFHSLGAKHKKFSSFDVSRRDLCQSFLKKLRRHTTVIYD